MHACIHIHAYTYVYIHNTIVKSTQGHSTDEGKHTHHGQMNGVRYYAEAWGGERERERERERGREREGERERERGRENFRM